MERKIEMEVILSPLAAKELARWLSEHIKDYERKFGEIKRPGAGIAEKGNPENQGFCPHPGLYVMSNEQQGESSASQRNGLCPEEGF